MSASERPEWYATLKEFERLDNSYVDDQYAKFWEEREEDDIDELRMKYANRYEKRRMESQYRKKSLTTVMGAFLNRRSSSGAVHEKTGWEFWELNPFEGKKNLDGDILLAKPDRGDAIVVLLLPERKPADKVVSDSKDSIEVLESGPTQFDFGPTNHVYGAIVVNPPRDEETSVAIKSNAGTKASDIFVWRVYDVEEPDESDPDKEVEKKILDYFAELDEEDLSPTGLHLNLLKVLEDKVEIRNGREILPDFFLESHHSVFLDHILGHIVTRRENRGDGPSTHFTRREIEEYISNTVFEMEVSAEAAEKTEYLLARWEQMDVIISIRPSRNEIEGDEFYRFTVPGNKSQTEILEQIMGDYEEKTIRFNIELDAMRHALEAYRDEYGEQATLTSQYGG